MDYQERINWFHQARFGIYIHYGLYSLLQRGEWTMYSERIHPRDYAPLADQFSPSARCAEEWVEAACRAGARYVVLTTRHHDGFCLFDSQHSGFTSSKRGPKRDLVLEYVTAARKAGLRVGLYYSLLDWRYPGYFQPEKYPDSYQALLQQVHGQVRELMSNYGKIDLLEYDGGWDAALKMSAEEKINFWRARELNAMVRQLQPEIIINNRSGLVEDFDTPEQVVHSSARGRAWESCMCIGDFCGWGYVRHNPNWKTSTQLLQHLISAAQGEGNYLLNVGPQPDGHLREEELDRLRDMGDWLARNGEAIYDSRRCALIGGSAPGEVDLNLQGPWTRRGNIGYWCIFRWPGREATAVRVGTPVKRVSLLASGEEFPFQYSAQSGKLHVSGLPKMPPDRHCSVLRVEFADEPKRALEPDLAGWMLP